MAEIDPQDNIYQRACDGERFQTVSSKLVLSTLKMVLQMIQGHIVEIPVARDQQARAHFLVTRTRKTRSKCGYYPY